MERCPNCQAEIREGSRFCTQCGTRVPDPADEQIAAADPWPSAPEQAVEPDWPLPEGVPIPFEEAVPAASTPASAEPGDDPIWAESPAGEETTTAPHVAAWPAPVEPTDQADTAGAWVSPEYGEAVVADAPWRPDVAADSPDAPGDVEPQSEDADPVPPAAPDPDEEAEALPLAALPESVGASGPVTDQSGPAMRAILLIEELRALLPSLGADTADYSILADRLEAVANEESGRWPDLRAAMEDARANPRDVETVLGLSRRVDDVIALIDANDRLTTAAREAAAVLRGGPANDT